MWSVTHCEYILASAAHGIEDKSVVHRIQHYLHSDAAKIKNMVRIMIPKARRTKYWCEQGNQTQTRKLKKLNDE